MNLHSIFTEARLQFDAARREQAELAAQALELKIAQRDALKAVGEIKTALQKLEAERAAAPPAKPATKPTEAKAITKSPTAKSPTTKTASKTITKPRRTLPEVEASLATLSQRITALSKRLTP